MLSLEGTQEPEQLAITEEDLLMLFEALHRLCDPHMPFHARNKDADLPAMRVEEYPHEFAVPSCPTADQAGSPSDSSTSAEEIPAPEYMWLANLLNAFGAKGGFDLVCKVRCWHASDLLWVFDDLTERCAMFVGAHWKL